MYQGAKMFYIRITQPFILVLISLFFTVAYSQTVSKEAFNIHQDTSPLLNNNKNQSSISHINDMLKKKQSMLLKTEKSHTIQYISLYDDIAELTISKNKLLLEMDRSEEINTDQICNFILDYEEVEFIKTQFYKTPFHDDVAKTVQNIASLYELCYPPMAGKYLKSVLRIKENIYGKGSVEAAKAHDMLGDHYRFSMADFKESIKQYEKAKKIRENIFGIKDPRVTENYEKLAISLFYHGDKVGEAEKLLHNAIDIRKNAPSTKDFPLYVAYMDLGIYYSMKDEYGKSIEYLQKALKSFEGKANSHYIVIVSELSQIYLNQDDLRKAQKYGEEAYRVAKEFYGNTKHYQVLENYNRLTEINDRMNK